MTHCNDQLIDQLLTQAEQEGRCLIPPSTAIRKALLRRTGDMVVSPMPGLFARKMRWDELNRAQRHCEIIRALAIIHPDWTFCSFSAACLLGLEVSWRHLNVVHVCSSTKPSARPGAHIQRHQIEPAGAIRRAGISVTPPIQTVTDCLLQTGFADGMPIADSAISKLGLTREQLMEAAEQRATARNGRAIRTALTTLRYADARAESGGESVARGAMIETGFAPDWLQYELTDPFDSAKPIRTDFAWERQARELTLGELDGLIKYTDQTMLAGRTTAEALVAERQREAHLSLYGHPPAALYHERGPLDRNARQKAADGRHPADRAADVAQRRGAVGAARPCIAGSHPPIWAAFSQRPRQRKARPSLDAQNGMHIPDGGPGGKRVPESGLGTGRAFRLSPSAETASRNKRSNWDALSKRPASGKRIPF